MGSADADALDFLRRRTQAGGIDEHHRKTIDVDGFLDYVTGRAGHGRDDGPLRPEQTIEPTRFAGVRLPDDGHAHPLTQDPATRVGSG